MSFFDMSYFSITMNGNVHDDREPKIVVLVSPGLVDGSFCVVTKYLSNERRNDRVIRTEDAASIDEAFRAADKALSWWKREGFTPDANFNPHDFNSRSGAYCLPKEDVASALAAQKKADYDRMFSGLGESW